MANSAAKWPPESPTRKAVRRLHRKGLTARQIAAELGISTQAVYAHLAKLRRSGEQEVAS
jgi:hypothetical protein